MSGLWAWIVSFFRRDERCLFRYWDGVKQRAIDPVLAYRSIWTSQDCNFLTDATTARNPPQKDGTPLYPIAMVYQAEDRLRVMTRKIFGVVEWSESTPGLTLDETDGLLNSFMEFCAELKKKRAQSQTPSVPSESMEPPDSLDLPMSSDAPAFPAGVDQDYCCSPSESNAAAPTGR